MDSHRLAIQSKVEVYPKGIKRPITIYDVTGIGGDIYNLSLTNENLSLKPLTHIISVEYVALEGKQVGMEHHRGSLQQLSAKTALLHIEAPEPLNLLTNIKLVITQPSAPAEIGEADIYAKVQKPGPTDQDYVITFTARSPAVITWLNEQVAD